MGEEEKTLIKADKIITGVDSEQNSNKVLNNAAVLIQDGKISWIGKQDELFEQGFYQASSEGFEVIDLEDKTLLPGLIDMHVHLGLNGETSMEPVLTKQLIPFLTAKASTYLQKDLHAGTTTIRSVGDKGFIDIGLKQAIRSGFVEGPRLSVSGQMLTITGGRDAFVPGLEFTKRSDSMFAIFDGPAEAAKVTREQLKYGVDWIKVGVTGAVTAGDMMPGAQQPTFEELQAICECARLYGVKVAGHAHGANGIKEAVKAGFDTIEHAMLIDDEGVELMAEHDTVLVPTLAPVHSIVAHGVESGIPRQVVERAKQGKERHLKSFESARENGIKMAAGTDTGMPFVYHGSIGLELELLVKAGMTEYEAILSATANASEALGMEEEIGTLEVGKTADLIAVSGNPLENIKHIRNVDFIMKEGAVYKR